MGKREKIKWLSKPEEHNYPASYSYLNLILDDDVCENIVKKLEYSPVLEFKAKDIFRASKLSLLGVSNSHVNKNLDKIEDEKKLSPILLVRDTQSKSVIVADGYHRMCAVYHYDEDALIPCQIVSLHSKK